MAIDPIIFRSAFPHSLAADAELVASQLTEGTYPTTNDAIGNVSVAGEEVRIPSRIYSIKPALNVATEFNEQQRQILACWFTRHHDGHIREDSIKKILPVAHDWSLPFIVQLIGEYVPQIIDHINASVEAIPVQLCLQFAQDNEVYLSVARHRVISYWNVYYRSEYPCFTSYPGYQAMFALGLWRQPDAQRLISK